MTLHSFTKIALAAAAALTLIACNSGSSSVSQNTAYSQNSGIVMAYAPLSVTSDTTAEFQFAAGLELQDLGLLFQCSLDGGAEFNCATGINFANLAPGKHTLVITATNTATGDVVATITITWTIDPSGPPCPTPPPLPTPTPAPTNTPTPVPTPCVLSLGSGVTASSVCGLPCPTPPCTPAPCNDESGAVACPMFVVCPAVASSLASACHIPPPTCGESGTSASGGAAADICILPQ